MIQLSMCVVRNWNRLSQALKMILKGSLSGSLIIVNVSVHTGETMVTASVEEKLLGVTLDKNLDFKSHVNAICKKAG